MLKTNELYLNKQKCLSETSLVHFLGYIMSAEGLQVDPSKVKAIQNWLQTWSFLDVCSFHGSTNFYQQFIRNFSTIIAPITNYLKQKFFTWEEPQ